MTARKPKPAITEQQPRFCRQCGKPLERHKGERLGHFAARRLCGLECRNISNAIKTKRRFGKLPINPLDDVDPDLRSRYEP